MSATSPAWMTVMLGTVAIYWLLPESLRRGFLVIATATFLALVDARALGWLAAYAVLGWVAAERGGRAAVRLALILPIGVLLAYKLVSRPGAADAEPSMLLPLGMSYFTFRALHYAIERSRGALEPHGFADYIAYLFFLPTILVGPIHRFPSFLDDREHGGWTAHGLSLGIEHVLVGYFKITVLGDWLLDGVVARSVREGSDWPALAAAWRAGALDGIELYVRFSGYSDIAIGFALMLGYRVMENFRFPFLQSNVADFWRRWHISLTSWSREYVFMPALSLSRDPYLATLASLVFIGLWHELSWRYLAWGLFHGIGIAVCLRWRRRKNRPRGPKAVTIRSRLVHAGAVAFTANWFFVGQMIVP